MSSSGYQYDYSHYYNYEVPDFPCPDEERRRMPETAFWDDMLEPHCNSSYDTVVCWPTTLAGHVAQVKCPAAFEGIPLNQNANATKECFLNGTWIHQANYSACMQKDPERDEQELHDFAIRVIYFVGFTISTAALLIALFIFCYFRSLRCLRNNIHCHLMCSFILKNILWIIMYHLLPKMHSMSPEQEHSLLLAWTCQLIVAGYNYLQLANFFWMLVEGMYLHIMIVWAYSVDKIRIWAYALFGWGFPFIFILIWGILKSIKDSTLCWLPEEKYYHFLYITPILIVLLINTCCLVSTVYIIITKLKATNAQQTQQFWQALKGTLILFPLLGLIYVVFITPPGDNPLARKIFQYFNAIAQGLQGLMVAVFYCFLHREVRQVLRNRFARWRESRSFGVPRASRGGSVLTKLDPSIMLMDVNSAKTDAKTDGQNGNAAKPSNGHTRNNTTEATTLLLKDEKETSGGKSDAEAPLYGNDQLIT